MPCLVCCQDVNKICKNQNQPTHRQRANFAPCLTTNFIKVRTRPNELQRDRMLGAHYRKHELNK